MGGFFRQTKDSSEHFQKEFKVEILVLCQANTLLERDKEKKKESAKRPEVSTVSTVPSGKGMER